MAPPARFSPGTLLLALLILLAAYVGAADAARAHRLPPVYDGAMKEEANGAQSVDRRRCYAGECDRWMVKVRAASATAATAGPPVLSLALDGY